MPQQAWAKRVEKELKEIHQDLKYLIGQTQREYELTPAEKRDHEEAEKECREERTTSLEDLKKELRLKHAKR